VFGFAERIINHINKPETPIDYSDTGKDNVFYEGQWYELNNEIDTVLILGIDSIESHDESRENSSQADFLALLIMNNEEKSFKVLHINRDTVTDIPQIDKYGSKYGTYTAQLALAHTYGGHDNMKCRNTVDAVNNLLYSVDIDHYLSLTMDAIPVLNDGMGGVTLTLEEDFTPLGENFAKGAEVTLVGDEALTFVRWRNDAPTTSNLDRMTRQRQYISALFDKYVSTDIDNTLETMLKVNEHLVSDCTINQMSDLLETLQDYTYETTLTLPGEAIMGSEYVEFHVDETELQKMVVELFYVPQEN
jgi:LCP family protein required for cell wall assembly